MKAYKVTTIITIILLIAITCVASFFGVYKLKDYKVREVVPDYILGMEFADSRIINLKVDETVVNTKIYDKDGNEITEKQDNIEYSEENGYTIVEEKINPDDKLTINNYKKAKSILKNRLKKLGVDQYNINLDETNGNLQIRIPENENTDAVIENLLQAGTFELKDSETDEVLLDTNNVDKATVVYGQTENSATVYLQIKLDRDGRKKLEEISKIYIETTAEVTNENGETENVTNTKNVGLYLSGEKIIETHFGQTLVDGILNIAMGSASNSETLEQYVVVANEQAAILNSGVLPITYEGTNNVEGSKITQNQINIAMYVFVGIVALMSIYFIIRLKIKGILASILQIGYIALLLLTLRYTNVKITFEGIGGIVLSAILNYIYIYKAFKNIELDFIKEITAKFALRLIPVYVIAVILSFNGIANIYSLGMTLVWGIINMYLYNLLITQITVKTIKN